jgi:hypothetical protein
MLLSLPSRSKKQKALFLAVYLVMTWLLEKVAWPGGHAVTNTAAKIKDSA